MLSIDIWDDVIVGPEHMLVCLGGGKSPLSGGSHLGGLLVAKTARVLRVGGLKASLSPSNHETHCRAYRILKAWCCNGGMMTRSMTWHLRLLVLGNKDQFPNQVYRSSRTCLTSEFQAVRVFMTTCP
jgi:hypothetical protein